MFSLVSLKSRKAVIRKKSNLLVNGKDGVAIVFSKVVGFQQVGLVTTCKHGVADAFDKLGGFQVMQSLAFQI